MSVRKSVAPRRGGDPPAHRRDRAEDFVGGSVHSFRISRRSFSRSAKLTLPRRRARIAGRPCFTRIPSPLSKMTAVSPSPKWYLSWSSFGSVIYPLEPMIAVFVMRKGMRPA